MALGMKSLKQPVSRESIASIPWMSAKSLSHVIRDVSIRGPQLKEVWDQIQSRADVIAHSFNAKQSALVVVGLGKIVSEHPEFVNKLFVDRFVSKFLHQIFSSCNSLDIAQILYGLSRLGKCVDFGNVIETNVPLMDVNSLSMTSLALSSPIFQSQLSRDLLLVILQRAVALENVNDQCIGQVLHLSTPFGADPLCNPLILILHAKLVDGLDQISFKSLALVLSSMCSSECPISPDFLSMLHCALLAKEYSGATLTSLGVILRSIQKIYTHEHVIDFTPVSSLLIEEIGKRNLLNQGTRTLGLLLSAISRQASTCNTTSSVVTASILNALNERPVAEFSEFISILSSMGRLGQTHPFLLRWAQVHQTAMTSKQLDLLASLV